MPEERLRLSAGEEEVRQIFGGERMERFIGQGENVGQ